MNINSNIKIDSCQIIKEAFLSSFKKTFNEIATNELITAYSDIYDLISRELCDKKNNSGYKMNMNSFKTLGQELLQEMDLLEMRLYLHFKSV